VIEKLSFRQKVHLAREDAIVQSVKRLLAEKGFDQMTVDEVAADVGIAKASLYKHFPSKEALASAAMVQTLDLALAEVERLQADASCPSALARLKALTRWTLRTQLSGDMPTLPSENSTLRATLMGDAAYMDRLMQLSDRLGEWISQAQRDGSLRTQLPAEVVLFTMFARACDPVVGFLKAGGRFTDDEVVDIVTTTCFEGLAAPV
jgi:TetR/AcrR family transcriptional regulator, regulator of autoinduction and epiphytic fitness